MMTVDDRPRRWALWTFRVLATAEAALTVTQAVFAGGFLAGDYDMLALHRDNSTIAVGRRSRA
ncbi:hypothetical protein [Umezawaea sp. NPDC059074]|uniref:hypothetical protein n=1 Tax=Umezawaea sp. NPDC059074 TaxID=3346716 RepID=UPI0036AA636A